MYRRYRTPSIWQEMNQFEREMKRLMEDRSKHLRRTHLRPAPSFPPMNIWADEDNALISAEIPGVEKDNLEINVTGDTLTLSGVRQPEELPEGAQVHRRERSYGEFSRSIQLPYTVDVNKVQATFKNGLLKIGLPRVEAEKPKKITVKSV